MEDIFACKWKYFTFLSACLNKKSLYCNHKPTAKITNIVIIITWFPQAQRARCLIKQTWMPTNSSDDFARMWLNASVLVNFQTDAIYWNKLWLAKEITISNECGKRNIGMSRIEMRQNKVLPILFQLSKERTQKIKKLRWR